MPNLGLNTSLKQSRFFQTLLKKNLEFVSNRKNSTITLNLDHILLSIEVDLIIEKQNYKKDALVTYNIACIKMIFILLTKVVTLYM